MNYPSSDDDICDVLSSFILYLLLLYIMILFILFMKCFNGTQFFLKRNFGLLCIIKCAS